jgi:hypothetical protein
MNAETQSNNTAILILIAKLSFTNSDPVIDGEFIASKDTDRFLKAIISAELEREGFYPPVASVSTFRIRIIGVRESNSSQQDGWECG